jgi:peptidoglycan/LPS O-acetylase OafA/YrhL
MEAEITIDFNRSGPPRTFHALGGQERGATFWRHAATQPPQSRRPSWERKQKSTRGFLKASCTQPTPLPARSLSVKIPAIDPFRLSKSIYSDMVEPFVKNQSRVIGLDVVRSQAILCVLGCHALILFSSSLFLRSAGNCLGIFGVEQFFVLSGFLIGSILIREISSAGPGLAVVRGFWARRWYRTLPNYYFYLILNLVAAGVWHHHQARLWAYPFFLQNFAWDMPVFFNVSWSLAIEEWFYLLFPLSILVAFMAFKLTRPALLASIFAFLALPLIARLAMGSHEWFVGVHMIVICRLDAIGLGLLLAYIKAFKPQAWTVLGSGWTALTAAFAALTMFILFMLSGYGGTGDAVHGPLENAFSIFGVDASFALLLPWFSNLRRMATGPRAAFTWVSILSYSLYLSNMTVVRPIGAFWHHFLGHPPPPFIGFVAWLVAITGLATFSYYFVELPFLRLRDRHSQQVNL